MKHYLKTWPEAFNAVWSGIKRYEIRKNDRHYECDDHLVLQEYFPEVDSFSGREIECVVTWMSAGTWGLPADLCVMSIEITKKVHPFTDS